MEELNVGKGKKEKSIVKNMFFNVLYRVVNMLFPLLTAIYISHVLKATGVGKVSIAQNIVQYFVLIAPLGISNYGTREIAKIRNKKEETEKLFTELCLINFCSTFCCVIAYYILIFTQECFEEERLLYIVSGFPIVFNFINVEWYYQGNEDYVYISIRSIIVKILSLVAMVSFVKTTDDYVIYSLIYTLGIAGNYIFNIANIVKRGIRLKFQNLIYFRHIRPILILLCSNIAIELYTLLDTTMLGYFCTDEIVGYYTNSIKLVRIIVSLIAAIAGVLLPRLSYYKENGQIQECSELINKVCMVMLFLAVPSGFAVIVLAPQLVAFVFGESFVPAVLTVRIASILIYVLGFSSFFGNQVLLTFEGEKKLLICTSFGAVSNIIMNAFLIPHYQHNGAVVASVISESIVTFLTILFAKKYIKISLSVVYIFQVIFAGIVMVGAICCIKILIKNDLLILAGSLFCGATIYFLIGFLLKNPILLDAKKYIVKNMLSV